MTDQVHRYQGLRVDKILEEKAKIDALVRIFLMASCSRGMMDRCCT